MKTGAIILCHPSGLVSPALLFWLQDIGIPRKNILFNPGNKWSWAVAMNQSMKRAAALADKMDRFIFADNDIRPEVAATAPMLAMPYDVTCARCDLETGSDSWKSPAAFHTGIFAIKSEVLQAIPSPWFNWSTTQDGAEMTACGCATFAAKVAAAGFTIGNAGWSAHSPGQPATLKPFICNE